jgi:hypothetical protein
MFAGLMGEVSQTSNHHSDYKLSANKLKVQFFYSFKEEFFFPS